MHASRFTKCCNFTDQFQPVSCNLRVRSSPNPKGCSFKPDPIFPGEAALARAKLHSGRRRGQRHDEDERPRHPGLVQVRDHQRGALEHLQERREAQRRQKGEQKQVNLMREHPCQTKRDGGTKQRGIHFKNPVGPSFCPPIANSIMKWYRVQQQQLRCAFLKL